MSRVLFCPPLFPPSRGGSQRLFADLAGLWAESGGESLIYTTAAPAGAPGSGSRDSGRLQVESTGLRLRRFAAFWAAAPAWRGRLLAGLARIGPAPWRAAVGFPHVLTRGYRSHLRLRAAALDGPFDLVVAGVLPHTHFMEPAARFARRHGLPWVAVPLVHTGLLAIHGEDRVLGAGAGGLLSTAARVVALTEAERPVLERIGVRPDRIAVLPAALRRAEPAGERAAGARLAGGEGRYILQAGALGADKGTSTLLQAHALRVAAGRRDLLVLAGRPDGATREALERLPPATARLTRLIESPPSTDWHHLMAGAAALAHPSRAESFGLVVLEAWRAGVPAVVADAGGLPRLVRNGRDGLVVPPDDPGALAAALDRLLDSPELAAGLAAAGRSRLLGELTWRTVFPAWRQLLESAMAAPARESAA